MSVAQVKALGARKTTNGQADQATKSIGERLRTLRKGQAVTLVELSQASGVDIATISRIETGRMTGTLECHVKLAAALGVKLTELYAGIEEARAKDAVSVQLPSQQQEVYVHEAGKSSMAMLTADILKKKLMPVMVTIEPGGSTHKEEARVGTERFLYVLEGAIQAVVGNTTHELKKGSSLYLDASIPHSLRNPGRFIAKILSVITPPML